MVQMQNIEVIHTYGIYLFVHIHFLALDCPLTIEFFMTPTDLKKTDSRKMPNKADFSDKVKLLPMWPEAHSDVRGFNRFPYQSSCFYRSDRSHVSCPGRPGDCGCQRPPSQASDGVCDPGASTAGSTGVTCHCFISPSSGLLSGSRPAVNVNVPVSSVNVVKCLWQLPCVPAAGWGATWAAACLLPPQAAAARPDAHIFCEEADPDHRWGIFYLNMWY